MTNKSRNYPGWQILLLLFAIGGIIGSWIGDAILTLWPAANILGEAKSVGIPAFTLDLRVIYLSFGFMLHINLFTIIGFFIAYIIYKRL